MTYREKLKKDTGRGINGFGCPSDHGYEEGQSFFTHCASTTCEACWSREMKEKENKPMKHKVGDTVLLQATIVDIDDEAPIEEWPIKVRFCDGEELRYNEEDLFELPKPDKTYEQGLADAWELARDLEKMRQKDLLQILGYTYWDVLAKLTPQEALAKLKAYEDSHSIKVGDVVEFADGTKAIVMDTDTDDSLALFTENGCVEAWTKPENVKKTGKHIDIESLLKQIQGDDNE